MKTLWQIKNHGWFFVLNTLFWSVRIKDFGYLIGRLQIKKYCHFKQSKKSILCYQSNVINIFPYCWNAKLYTSEFLGNYQNCTTKYFGGNVTKHLRDTFARDNLPPPELFPEFSNLAELEYPEKLNYANFFWMMR